LKIKSFPIKMGEDSALRLSQGRVNFFTSLWLGKNPKIVMKRVFIENRIITFAITSHSLLERFFKKESPPKSSRIRMIANGSTCGVAYYDGSGLDIVEIDVDDGEVQFSDYPDDVLITRGNVLARKILRRRIGGNLSLNAIEAESVFRPYYVAFYGEPTEGSSVRYLPIAADSCVVRRTF
jgi:hypothetical protein